MATVKQRKAAERMVENGGNASKAMRDAGYSKATAKTPDKLTKSLGFQELLDELLPDSFILQALRDDIQAKPGDRSRELTIATKIKGMEKNTLEVTGDSKLTVEIVSFGKD
jgi:hypothetical protein